MNEDEEHAVLGFAIGVGREVGLMNSGSLPGDELRQQMSCVMT